jgi:hypothetical protein
MHYIAVPAFPVYAIASGLHLSFPRFPVPAVQAGPRLRFPVRFQALANVQ